MTFTTRAAGEMRTRLTDLGVPGVQARTFHSAALRQARFFWPQVYDRDLPQIIESKLGLVGRGRRCLPDVARSGRKARRRFARSSGRRSATSRSRTTRAWPTRLVAPCRESSRSRSLGSSGPTSRPAAIATGSTSRTCCCALPGSWPATRGPRRPSGRSTGTWSWTSTRTSRHCSRRCSTSGSATTATCAWWAIPPRPSTPSPGHGPTSCASSPSATPVPRSCRCTATTAPLRRLCATANALMARADAVSRRAHVRLSSERGPGPRSRTASTPTRWPRRTASPAPSVPWCRPACPRVTSRSSTGSTPSPNRWSRRSPTPVCAYQVRGGERFFDRAEVREAMAMLRGAAVAEAAELAAAGVDDPADDPDAQPEPLEQAVAGALSAVGYSSEPPTGTGRTRERWESLSALVALGRRAAAGQGSPRCASFVDVLVRALRGPARARV